MKYRVFFKKPLCQNGYYKDVEARDAMDAVHYVKALHANAIIISVFSFDEYGNLIKEAYE